MDCPFQLNADGLWECPHEGCEWVDPIKSDKPPRRNCPASPDLRPAAEKLGIEWKDVPHYAQALAKWTAAGFPTRSQEEVARCLRICKGNCEPSDEIRVCKKPCEHYSKGRCKLCRCNVNLSRFALVNKIRMGTENCPEGKW